ncbi:MAG: GntR family transcriptional regulator, partial [Salinibacterium amurskyense]
DNEPLTYRAKRALTESILAGAFPDGQLPAEDRLAQQIGVSRATLRAAMRSLEEEGLVSRQRGVGTRINTHIAQARTSLNRTTGFFDLIADAGYAPDVTRTTVGEIPAPEVFASRIAAGDDEQVVRISRVFTADADPIVHAVELVQGSAITGEVSSASELGRSIFEFADQHCERPVDHSVVELSPVPAEAEIAAELRVAVGEPVLRLIETHYDASGVPMIVSLVHIADRKLQFTLVRRRY